MSQIAHKPSARSENDPVTNDYDLGTFLSALRWICAWVVLLTHARGHWFVARADAVPQNVAFDAFAWVSGFGHAAVMAFFVLSGYLVGGRALDIQRAGGGYRRYVTDRITRLHIVLLPSFALSYALVMVGAALIGDPSIVDRPENSLFALGANVLSLQTIVSGQFAHNLPLWSLSNEFWYYMMTPLLLMGFMEKRKLVRWSSVAVLVGMLLAFRTSIAPYWAVWLLGLGVRLGWFPRIDRRLAIAAWILIVASKRTFHVEGALWLDLIQGAALALVIASYAGARAGTAGIAPGIHHRLAAWSFSLYVMHFPIMLFIATLLSGREGSLGLQPSLGSFAQFGLVIGAVLFCSWLFAHCTEYQTDRVRRWLTSRTSVASSSGRSNDGDQA